MLKGSSPITFCMRTRANTSSLPPIKQHKGTRAHQPQDCEESLLDTSRGNRDGQERVLLPLSCFSDTQSFCHNAAPNRMRTGSLCSEPPPSSRPYLVRGAFYPLYRLPAQETAKAPCLLMHDPQVPPSVFQTLVIHFYPAFYFKMNPFHLSYQTRWPLLLSIFHGCDPTQTGMFYSISFSLGSLP